jgi:tRNA G18 (ribose-2'-O)-methylase SpoU
VAALPPSEAVRAVVAKVGPFAGLEPFAAARAAELAKTRGLRGSPGGRPGMISAVPTVPVEITDPSDPRLADFRDLRAGDRRPDVPRGTGAVIVEGVPAVQRLLASPYPIRAVLGVPGRVAALDLPDGIPAYEADKWVLSEVIGFRLTRGVLASADRLPPVDVGTLVTGPDPAAPRRLVVLEGLNDAENLGSIARSAVALGVDAMLLDPRCADPLYRRAVRVSMGHVLGLPFAVLPDWPAGLGTLHAAGYLTVALTPAADAVDLATIDARAHPRTAVVLGAEGPGLTAEAQRVARVRARIPMRAGVDSLGVAAAAAVAFAALR